MDPNLKAGKETTQQVEIKLIIGLWMGFAPIILLLTAFGNSVGIFILLRKNLRHRKGTTYLIVLMVVDMVHIYTGSLISKWVEFGFDKINNLSPRCKPFQDFVNSTARTTATFVLVAMTTERALAVCSPFIFQRYCRKKKSHTLLATLVALSALFHVHRIFGSLLCPAETFQVMCPFSWNRNISRPRNDSVLELLQSQCGYAVFYVHYVPVLDAMVSVVLPLCIVLGGDLAVAYKIFIKDRNDVQPRSSLVQSSGSPTTPQFGETMSVSSAVYARVWDRMRFSVVSVARDNTSSPAALTQSTRRQQLSRMTRLSSMLNFVYFLATIPYYVMVLVQKTGERNFYQSPVDTQMGLGWTVTTLLLYGRASLDLPMLFFLLPAFRATTLSLLPRLPNSLTGLCGLSAPGVVISHSSRTSGTTESAPRPVSSVTSRKDIASALHRPNRWSQHSAVETIVE